MANNSRDNNNNVTDLLLHVLPRAGFVWPAQRSITSRAQFDAKIQDALRATKLRFSRKDITPLIASTFDEATAKILAFEPVSDTDEMVALYDAIELAQGSTSWAAAVPSSIFAEFLLEIKEARLRAIEDEKLTPVEGTLAATLTIAVDAFADAIATRDWDFNEELMALAGHDNDTEWLPREPLGEEEYLAARMEGLGDEDEDEDENEMEPEMQDEDEVTG
ncbi:hypothetical protein DL546_007875 [Coniochaeta pulveracea]|uniref:Uncharacterized protein n=1 Tax=Coniochaeta pulveracea TaxID=177199 RepID=A0A420YH63_9PEZI|nr:hypothetical protein DL546_007875 [Coniochaeta pulveracea]